VSDPSIAISDDDLHAFVDGQLPPQRQAAVARHLQEQPEAAERVAAYVAQREALRAAFAPIAAEPVPPRLDLQSLIAGRLSAADRRTAWRAAAVWQVAAAVLLALLVGGAGGWALHGRFGAGPSDLALLAQDAIANHVVYTADRKRPTELGAEQRDDLAKWVSNRLGRPVAPPDMSAAGFRYMGGRLAATPQGPAGQFMYQNADGKRLTVFVLPMRDAPDTATRTVDIGTTDGCAWIDKGVGYTVVAPVPPKELHDLAVEVRRQLEAAT
jgi:anti-sigma factor RsiW